MAQLVTNLAEALKHLQARYVSLSVYGNKIMAAYRAAPKGTPLPCDVIDAYHKAVKDHLAFGQKVFDLIIKNKMHVEQIVYTAGKPKLDAKGNVKTLRIDAPLRPPVFMLDGTNCSNITRVAGAGVVSGHVEIGFLPAIPIALLATYFIGAIAVIGTAGYVSVKVLAGIKAIFSSGPDYNPDKQVDAYVKCMDKSKAAGMSPEQILKGCGTTEGALKVPPGGTNWGVVIAAVGALTVGGIYLTSKKGGA